MKCIFPKLEEAMKGWDFTKKDLQRILMVNPERMKNLLYGRTEFTPLEKHTLARSLMVDESELFEKEEK